MENLFQNAFYNFENILQLTRIFLYFLRSGNFHVKRKGVPFHHGVSFYTATLPALNSQKCRVKTNRFILFFPTDIKTRFNFFLHYFLWGQVINMGMYLIAVLIYRRAHKVFRNTESFFWPSSLLVALSLARNEA